MHAIKLEPDSGQKANKQRGFLLKFLLMTDSLFTKGEIVKHFMANQIVFCDVSNEILEQVV